MKPRAFPAAVAAQRPPALNPVSHEPEERGEQASRRLREGPLAVRDADLANDSATGRYAYSWQAAGGDAVESPPAEAPPAPLMAGTSAPWPIWRWLVPVIAGLLLLAAGVFCLGAQYWLPSALEMDPSKFHGLNMQPWGLVIYQASPALLGGGTGVLGGMLFLASRRSASREAALRIAFGLLALAVGAAGWAALFAMVLFPDLTHQRFAHYDAAPQPAPLAYVLMPCGTWWLAVALLMLAALFVVPRRWRHFLTETETETETGGAAPIPDGTIQSWRGTHHTGEAPSTRRGLLFGVVVLAAAAFTLFAAYLFPLSTGVNTVATSDGGTYIQQAWAAMAGFLTTPLLLSGLVVLGWACFHFAVSAHRTGGETAAAED